MQGADPAVQLNSPLSLTPECRSELGDDTRLGDAPFGPALPLEPIDGDGRIDGDVIYAADLGERNELLRARFGDRTWRRLTIVTAADGAPRPIIVPY